MVILNYLYNGNKLFSASKFSSNIIINKIETLLIGVSSLDVVGNESYLTWVLVDNNYIHELNRDYRHIDRETDVITFALEDEKDMVVPDGERVLGDIYISIDKAKSQAKEYGHSLLRELTFLAVHGFYHLLGYDHMTKEEEEIMFSKQEEVLHECNIER